MPTVAIEFDYGRPPAQLVWTFRRRLSVFGHAENRTPSPTAWAPIPYYVSHAESLQIKVGNDVKVSVQTAKLWHVMWACFVILIMRETFASGTLVRCLSMLKGCLPAHMVVSLVIWIRLLRYKIRVLAERCADTPSCCTGISFIDFHCPQYAKCQLHSQSTFFHTHNSKENECGSSTTLHSGGLCFQYRTPHNLTGDVTYFSSVLPEEIRNLNSDFSFYIACNPFLKVYCLRFWQSSYINK